ncbi:DNA-directed RNA polymerases I and III 40 kDa polypeptide [Calocera cornea HHB12733]|uniref:DNA-directed RNA polymerases I and III subunit RPAC1 n=1 Tax=Calocera cornea HHB12733 TaxID=1353952 RepID=A0A165ERK3_9BASI|nr:DNA-directed RNA polymerases I and III 40 kDa polypeptide [Calocera cornea HHB12733]
MDEIDPRRLVQIHPERISHVSSTDYPGHWPGEDHTWDLAAFRNNLRLDIQRLTPSTLDFDLVGVDASIANALRRILIAEVETIAVEKVFIWQNTSVMQDEVLAARLGLVPLRIHPGRLESWVPDATATDANTISFQLQVSCTRRPNVSRDETDPSVLYENSAVYSSSMLWQPVGQQAALPDWLADPPAVAAPDIVLVKLRPGQEVHAELHCVKACGREHAKWSPVATATYRLMPHIRIVKPIPERLHATFMQAFSPGVIGRRRTEGKKAGEGEWEVYVKDPRKDTVSRNVFLHPELKDCVKLGRVRDHFLFTLESAGQMPPQALLPEAIAVLRRKIRVVSEALEELMHPTALEEEEEAGGKADAAEEGAMDVDA